MKILAILSLIVVMLVGSLHESEQSQETVRDMTVQILESMPNSRTLQKDLKTTPSQLKKLEMLIEAREKVRPQAGAGSGTFGQKQFDSMRAERNEFVKGAMELFKPQQRNRLKQIALQKQCMEFRFGLNRVGFFSPILVLDDQLSRETKVEFNDQGMKSLAEFQESRRAHAERLMKQVLKSLPESKRIKFAKLAGKPYSTSMGDLIVEAHFKLAKERKKGGKK